MENHDEFLLEEYKETMRSGLWLEENLEKKFRTVSIVFIWQIILVGYLLKDSFAKDQNIFILLNQCNCKLIISIISLLVAAISLITIDNMGKARINDVLCTSRINFIRDYFLRNMQDKSKDIYLNDKRLKEINKIDIYARPLLSWGSDCLYFIILCVILGWMSILIFSGSIAGPSPCICILVSIIYLIFSAFFICKNFCRK